MLVRVAVLLLAAGVAPTRSLRAQDPYHHAVARLVAASLAAVERAAADAPPGPRFIDLDGGLGSLSAFLREPVNREELLGALPTGCQDAVHDTLLECPGASRLSCRLRVPGVRVTVDSAWTSDSGVHVWVSWRRNNTVRPDRGMWSSQWEVVLRARDREWDVVSVRLWRLS